MPPKTYTVAMDLETSSGVEIFFRSQRLLFDRIYREDSSYTYDNTTETFRCLSVITGVKRGEET